MNLKKTLAVAIIVAQLVTMVPFGMTVSAADPVGIVEAKAVSSSPIINGDLSDSVWNLSNNIALAPTPVSHSATYDVKWDYSYLYVAVQVKGDTELVDSPAWCVGDDISIFIDPTKHKSAPYAEGDWQIGIGYNAKDEYNPYVLLGSGINATTEKKAALLRNTLAVAKKTADGWNAEVAIPWKNLGIDPYLQKSFGFDIAVDNMHGGIQDYLYWHVANGATAFWNTTVGFGEMNLSTTMVNNTDSDVIYQENFDSTADGAVPSGFLPIAGQEAGWSVQSGKLVGDFKASGATQRRISLPALGDNFTYSVDATYNSVLNSARWISEFYRAPLSNSPGYYQFSNRQNGAGEISSMTSTSAWLYFVNTNSPTPPSTAALTLGKTYNLTATAFGQQLHHVRTGTTPEEAFDYSYDTYTKFGTDLTNLLERGRFGLQIDQSNVSFDNIVIKKLEATALTVTNLPDSVNQLDLITPTLSAHLSNGTDTAVNLRDAKIYSSDKAVLKVNTDGTLKALQVGKSTVGIIVGNQLVEKEVTVNKSNVAPVITSLTPPMTFYKAIVGDTLSAAAIPFAAVDETETKLTINGSDSRVTWSSSDETIVKYDSADGNIKALKAGAAVLSAKVDNVTAEISVWVRKDASDNIYLSETFEGGALPSGWSKLGSTGTATVEAETVNNADGSTNHYLNMAPSTRLLIPMPKGVGDYTIDADITFMQVTNDARWASIMYRIQNQDYPYFQFAVRQNATAANGTEFAFRNKSNAWDVRQKSPFTKAMALGEKHHMKITATGNRVKQYLDGVELEFTNLAGDYLTGDIGLQTDAATVRFDNVTVDLNPATLPDVPKADAQYSAPKLLSSNLVDTPTVIYNKPVSISQIKTLIADKTTSSMLMDLMLESTTLNVYSGSKKVGTIAEVTAAASGNIIMMYSLKDKATADALAAYITANGLEDLNVVSSDAALLKDFRSKALKTRATLVVTSSNISLADAYTVAGNASTANCMSVILQQSAASKDVVEAIQSRMISVWVACDDTTVGMHKVITSGATGILTQSPDKLTLAAKLYDKATLTHRSFIVGHRGIPSLAPENTMASYKMAMDEYGADMLENDVYLTKDKQVILLHDTTFARTTDIKTTTAIPDSVFTDAGVTRASCKPSDLTLEQIRKLDAGSWYNAKFAGEKIPTLEEMIAYMKGKDVRLVLELKDASEGIEQACVDIIKKYNFFDQVNVITFNQKSIPIMKSIAPTLSIATLSGITAPSAEQPRAALRDVLNSILVTGAAYDASYAYEHNDDFIHAATARGLQLWGWTYTDKTNFAWAIGHGITGITNNNSDWAANYAFTLKPEKTSYEIDKGGSITVKANAITNLGKAVACTPELVVIDGQDTIQVSGNTITALKNGTATILMRTPSAMESATYDIYTQPVTIQVGKNNGGEVTTTTIPTPTTPAATSSPVSTPATTPEQAATPAPAAATTIPATAAPKIISDTPTGISFDITNVKLPTGVTKVSVSALAQPANSDVSTKVSAILAKNPQINTAASVVVEDFKLLDQNGNPVTSFTGKIKVKLPIPAGMSGNLHVYYYNPTDGTLTDMGATIENGYIVFETDHFSYYAIAQLAGAASGTSVSSGAGAKPTSSNPKTGDTAGIAAVVLLAMAAGAVMVIRRKVK